MRHLLKITIVLAVLTAGTVATRADEMSELVAIVAGNITPLDSATSDIRIVRLDTLPRYKSHSKPDIDLSLLDSIYNFMEINSTIGFLVQNIENFVSQPSKSVLSFSVSTPGRFQPSFGKRRFFRPVPGVITSRFGWRPQFQRVHHGVDLCLNVGDTVRAAFDGTIEKISYDHDGYGNYVIIIHPDGMETVYGHLEYALVAQGQAVSFGQPIGIGGNTGNSTGPHLHFEARLGGIAVDPLLIFDFYGISSLYSEEQTPTTTIKGPVYSHQSKSLANEQTYIVRYGDTPESVARQAGISVMRLRQLNMLTEGQGLTVGRMLKLK